MEVHYENLRVNKLFKNSCLKEIESFISRIDIDKQKEYKKEGERQFAEYNKSGGAYFVDSGTKALKIALYLSGIRKDDEVIMPAVSWASPAIAVLSLKAKPVFVDIKKDCTIDEKQIDENITSKTKAVIPIHLFGHLCEMSKIMKICEENNLKIVEDACQSHGSTYNGKNTGNFGMLNAFSFDIRKTISSMGTGGAITFNQPSFYSKIDKIINFTSDSEDSAYLCTGQSKISPMDTISILSKIRYSKLIEKNKIENTKKYEDILQSPKVKKIEDKENNQSIRMRYVCYFEERDKLNNYLKENKIIAEEPYLPMPRMKIFSKFAEGKEFPNSDYYHESSLHLPLFSMMTKKEVLTVGEKIKEFYT